MNDIEFVKISTNMVDFLDITGTLNIKERKMNFDLTAKQYNILFPIDPKIKPANIDFYLVDKDKKEYSCIGCIAGLKFSSSIKIEVININLIFENTIIDKDNVMTDFIEFETTYPKHYIYGSYINNFDIKYTADKTIHIKKIIDDENIKINISINSKKLYKREKLDDVLYAILEIIYLIFGSIPHLNKYSFKYNNKEILLHFDLVDKYKQNTKSGSSNDALSIIDEKVLNKDLIKRFIKFRKETAILYDMFLISQSGLYYTEITNSILIQLMEGTYLTLNKVADEELWKILEFYFIKNPQTNMLLNKKDLKPANDKKKTPIFLYKAKEHRNYLSHLNMNEKKNFFYELENNYAKFKLILCLRLIYMDYLGISYNKSMLDNIIKSIDEWGKNNKIKI